MKKTLVALAALATVGAAFAQSSVTLYGKVDWEIVSKSTRTAAGVTTNPGIQVNSAGLSGSRWGMKGSEDLGGGMSAIFDLQGGFSVDTGQLAQGGGAPPFSANAGLVSAAGVASGQRIFGRQAFAGVKGGFGQFTVGRQYAPYDNAFGVVDSQGYTSNSAMGSVWAGGIHADGGGPGRIDNHVTYYTPAMGGFNAQLSWAPGENRAPGVSASRYTGLGLGYANGPINAQFAYEGLKAAAGGGTTDAWLLGGSYDFGVARLYAAYERADSPANTKDKGWSIGTAVPVGPATLQLGYARENTRVAGAAASSFSRGFGGQLVYNLSKRTNVYAEMMNTRTTAAGAAASSRARQFGVGMRHDF